MTKNELLMQPYGPRILVQIDKKAQREKLKYKKGVIEIPEEFKYMIFNLQYGKILAVGDAHTRSEAKKGLEAIFHHRVESLDTNNKLIQLLANGDEVRWLSTNNSAVAFEYFGVIDKKGNIIPANEFVFCEPKNYLTDENEYENVKLNAVNRGGFNTKYGSDNGIMAKKQGNVYITDATQKSEQAKIFLNCKILFVPEVEKVIKPGKIVTTESFSYYPINLKGKDYWILHREHILGIHN